MDETQGGQGQGAEGEAGRTERPALGPLRVTAMDLLLREERRALRGSLKAHTGYRGLRTVAEVFEALAVLAALLAITLAVYAVWRGGRFLPYELAAIQVLTVLGGGFVSCTMLIGVARFLEAQADRSDAVLDILSAVTRKGGEK